MKHKVGQIVAFFAYWLGVDALFYWLNRRAKRILTFHNVLQDELFRRTIANGVSNSLSEFVQIIGECSKRFSFSNDLTDTKTLTITFDDGYRCQYTTAFKTLNALGIPGYVFVAGDVEKGDGLMVDKLLHWVAEVPLEFVPGGDRTRYWIDIVWPEFVKDSEGKGQNVLRKLNVIYPYEKVLENLPQEYVEERLGCISELERGEMRKAGWKVGWHTWRHYPVSRLSEKELREAMSSPEEYRDTCLSYPYGNPVEVGDRAISMAKEYGYPHAVSNTNLPGISFSRYFLPRMAFISSDKYEVNFELSGFKYFLKWRRLLPCLSM